MAQDNTLKIIASLNMGTSEKQIKQDLKTIAANINAKKSLIQAIAGLNVASSTKQVQSDLKTIAAKISSKGAAIKVNAGLNIASSGKQIKTDLKSVEGNIASQKPVTITAKVKVDAKQAVTDAAKSVKGTKELTEDQLTTITLGKQSSLTNLEAWWNKNSKASNNESFQLEFERLKTALTDVNRTDLSHINKEIAIFQNNVRSAGNDGQTFGDTFKNVIGKFSDWGITSKLVAKGFGKIGEIIDNVTQINTAMVELRKVTDETDATYSSFLDRANSKAVKLGTTISTFVTSTANFSKMGYSLPQAEKLAETANIYYRVGDNMKSVDQANQSITSTMKAFNIEAENSNKIIDVFNEVSKHYAVQSGDMGDAMQSAGTALSTGNNSLEQSVALWTAMTEALQNGDAAAASLRLISQRMRNTAGQLEVMGEDADGAAESITKLQEQILNITGVNIMSDADSFRSTYDVLKDISGVWDDLTNNDRSDVINLLAGEKQASEFSALMQNFGTAEGAYDTALNSAGSAEKEYSVWLDSIEAKQQQATAQFQAFSNAILSSELVKGVYSAGTGILGFLTQLISTFGALPTVVGGISAALSLGGKQAGKVNMPTLRKTFVQLRDVA